MSFPKNMHPPSPPTTPPLSSVQIPSPIPHLLSPVPDSPLFLKAATSSLYIFSQPESPPFQPYESESPLYNPPNEDIPLNWAVGLP